MEDLYQVGAITQTHGIKGEVKVFPMTDDVSRFKNMKGLILDTGKERITLEVTSARPQKNLVILKFKEYDNINDVERFKGCGLYVTKENRVKCENDEYFIADLIDMAVVGGEMAAGHPQGHVPMFDRQVGNFNHRYFLHPDDSKKKSAFHLRHSVFAGVCEKRFFSL